MVPKMRSAVAEIMSLIHTLESLQDQMAKVSDSTRLLLGDPAIRATARISELPHRRESTCVEQLEDSERNSFLREAEVLKRISSDKAELLAVFRHVPIEVISRLRFLADSREILYTIQDESKRTQTRVHDLAVIRDTASQEIHLVPHRTKSRSISLT
jgi:predicted transcriptional regulator